MSLADLPYDARLSFSCESEQYQYGEKSIPACPSDLVFDEFRMYLDWETHDEHCKILKISIDPYCPLEFSELTLDLQFSHLEVEKVFCNGFQSWTESRAFYPDEQMQGLRKAVAPLMQAFGDYGFTKYKEKPGQFHSWTYSIQYHKDHDPLLLASLDERTAYTKIVHNVGANIPKLRIRRDVEGLSIIKKTVLCRLLFVCSPEPQLHQYLQKRVRLPLRPCPPVAGWTSWYNYYTDIDPNVLRVNVNALKNLQAPIDIFQIDDGWQQAVGDWELNDKFKDRMVSLVRHIKTAGYRPGLWLAPFVAEKDSKIARDHPDWILQDERGRRVKAGYTPLWSGHFYALDIYNEAFRSYLELVFRRLIEDWGFRFVKLDFLYAAGLVPRKGKTRAQVMFDGLQWLRSICGEVQILGCGVPLGPAFGLVDYCRIGADIHLSWEHKLLKFLRNRERVSTVLSLQNTINRAGLNRLAWGNDPDVFILRKQNHELSKAEQYTIFAVNQVFGQLIFCSDRVDQYSKSKRRLYLSQFPLKERELVSMVEDRGLYHIRLLVEGRRFSLISNLSEETRVLDLGLDAENGAISSNPVQLYNEESIIQVLPHHSILLREFSYEKDRIQLVASDLHFFAGTEIGRVDIRSGQFCLPFVDQLVNKSGVVWLLMSRDRVLEITDHRVVDHRYQGDFVLLKLLVGK